VCTLNRILERAIDSHDPVVRKDSKPPNEPLLRAKYLDWCSARVAKRFVKLTPEEIYQLAERAAHGSPPGGRMRFDYADPTEAVTASPSASTIAAPAVAAPGETFSNVSFRAIVARVTEALAAELNLPDYEDWADAYRRDPSRYDDELLGLWREAL
jgi:hypothetical protein